MNPTAEQLQENFPKFIIYILGIILAIILGLASGSGNSTQIGKVFIIIGFITYTISIQQYTWKIIYFLACLGFTYIPGGFAFTTPEITCAGLFGLFVATWWCKDKPGLPVEMEQVPFKLFNFCLLAWVIYTIGHAGYTIFDPIKPDEVAIKNLLKTYMSWTGVPLAILYFVNRPQTLKVNKDFPRTIGAILLFGLTINLAIRIYAFCTGRFGGDDTLTLMEINDSLFRIPIIGATENIYVFRTLGPTAILISIAYLSSEWIRAQQRRQRIIFQLCLLFGIIGTLISGGRASIIIAITFTALIFFLQKKYHQLLGVGFFSLITIVLINILYHTGAMQHMPPMVLRSSSGLIINKGAEAKNAFHGSNDWRYDLFEAAINEWKSDPRIFWFGRSTYSYGEIDILDIKLHGGEGVMNASLRRGTTHNLITDILIVFGLSGFCLFMALIASFLWVTWGIYRYRFYPNVEASVRSLALIAFVSTAGSVGYGMIAGGGMIDGLFLLLIVSRISSVHHTSIIKSSSSMERPALPHSGRYLGPPEFLGHNSPFGKDHTRNIS